MLANSNHSSSSSSSTSSTCQSSNGTGIDQLEQFLSVHPILPLRKNMN